MVFVHCRTHLGFRADFDCSVMSSLARRPVSRRMQRLRCVLRVSFQCHRAPTGGSNALRRRCNSAACSGSSAAKGGSEGSALNKENSSTGSRDIASRSWSETLFSSWVIARAPSWAVVSVGSSLTSLSGNSRCCIQYEVPPTTMGTSAFVWASSIY